MECSRVFSRDQAPSHASSPDFFPELENLGPGSLVSGKCECPMSSPEIAMNYLMRAKYCGWLPNPFPATFQKPWNDSISLYCKYQQTLVSTMTNHGFISWCEMDLVHPQYDSMSRDSNPFPPNHGWLDLFVPCLASGPSGWGAWFLQLAQIVSKGWGAAILGKETVHGCFSKLESPPSRCSFAQNGVIQDRAIFGH